MAKVVEEQKKDETMLFDEEFVIGYHIGRLMRLTGYDSEYVRKIVNDAVDALEPLKNQRVDLKIIVS